MLTVPRMTKLLEPRGYNRHPIDGWVGFHRLHNGRHQLLHFCEWENIKIAESRADMPRGYLTILPVVDAEDWDAPAGPNIDSGGRHRLPIWDWPDNPTVRRSWADVSAELESVFLAAMDAPTEEGRRRVAELDYYRYAIR